MFPKLESIMVDGLDVEDIGAIWDITELKSLSLRYYPQDKIQGISNLTKLEELILYNCEIQDADFLNALENLRSFKLWYYSQEAVEKILEADSLRQVEELTLYGCSLTDLEFLSDMPNLKILDVRRNPDLGADSIRKIMQAGVIFEWGESFDLDLDGDGAEEDVEFVPVGDQETNIMQR